jgi:hypothetical protein
MTAGRHKPEFSKTPANFLRRKLQIPSKEFGVGPSRACAIPNAKLILIHNPLISL